MTESMRISALRKAYSSGDYTPEELIKKVLANVRMVSSNPIWIYVLSLDELRPYLENIMASARQDLPLYGIPFAIKDNIDLAGVPTSAACPEFTYIPEKSAAVVQRLIDAGAIPVGKTNMDQFATGLVGVRSPEPWGPCRNAFDENIIAGGSSSGSAVALSLGQVSFSLGTDTAGSGRVPAALNNLVGVKPSKGLISCAGVVPACKSLDCVSIFALNTDDANAVFDVAVAKDEQDAYSRSNPYSNSSRYYKTTTQFTFGVPSKEQLCWFGLAESEKLFARALENIEAAGGTPIGVDFQAFIDAARLLYDGPWVAERYLATQNILEEKPEALLPVIRQIVSGGKQPSAAEGFSAQYKLAALNMLANRELARVDAIVTPTIPRYYSIAEVHANPINLNSNLGYYTNFMNLLDCCAVAVPTGHYENGVGFGVTLLQQAFSDKRLLSIAAAIQNQLKLAPGNCKETFAVLGEAQVAAAISTVDIVVCGAHLQGLPLNWQLYERGANLVNKTSTSSCYQLYVLPGGPPKRPGLMRVNENGVAIEIEVWCMPIENFGSFAAEIPAPLGLGKVELQSGEWLTGFICDNWGLSGAKNISQYGAWRGYLSSGV